MKNVIHVGWFSLTKSANTLVDDTLYQLQFVTSPNEGFYEASVKMKRGVPSLAGDISRIDAYKDQPLLHREEISTFAEVLLLLTKLLRSGHDSCIG